MKESLGIKSGAGGQATPGLSGNKLQDDYLRLCQISAGNNASTINNNKSKGAHPPMIGK